MRERESTSETRKRERRRTNRLWELARARRLEAQQHRRDLVALVFTINIEKLPAEMQQLRRRMDDALRRADDLERVAETAKTQITRGRRRRSKFARRLREEGR